MDFRIYFDHHMPEKSTKSTKIFNFQLIKSEFSPFVDIHQQNGEKFQQWNKIMRISMIQKSSSLWTREARAIFPFFIEMNICEDIMQNVWCKKDWKTIKNKTASGLNWLLHINKNDTFMLSVQHVQCIFNQNVFYAQWKYRNCR